MTAYDRAYHGLGVAVDVGLAVGVLAGHFFGWWVVIAPLALLGWNLYWYRAGSGGGPS